jgi:hypothetical protein
MMAKSVSAFRRLLVVQLCLFAITAELLVISWAGCSYADLTFHPTKQIAETLSHDLGLYEKQEFPRHSGADEYVAH